MDDSKSSSRAKEMKYPSEAPLCRIFVDGEMNITIDEESESLLSEEEDEDDFSKDCTCEDAWTVLKSVVVGTAYCVYYILTGIFLVYIGFLRILARFIKNSWIFLCSDRDQRDVNEIYEDYEGSTDKKHNKNPSHDDQHKSDDVEEENNIDRSKEPNSEDFEEKVDDSAKKRRRKRSSSDSKHSFEELSTEKINISYPTTSSSPSISLSPSSSEDSESISPVSASQLNVEQIDEQESEENNGKNGLEDQEIHRNGAEDDIIDLPVIETKSEEPKKPYPKKMSTQSDIWAVRFDDIPMPVENGASGMSNRDLETMEKTQEKLLRQKEPFGFLSGDFEMGYKLLPILTFSIIFQLQRVVTSPPPTHVESAGARIARRPISPARLQAGKALWRAIKMPAASGIPRRIIMRRELFMRLVALSCR
uniref:Uncharacterized protein n=1 Tax=Bursaphelenchus xylophilus TaxID=6326 RepID=A0A1I7SES2_BURXY